MTAVQQVTGSTLEIIDLTRRFNSVIAVDHVSLSLRAGEIVAILGPSGSGKSTLLSMIGGQQRPDSGDIRISGHSIVNSPPNRRETATVFQDYALFPHLTVAENIAFGLRMHGWPKEAMLAQVARMLELVGLTGLEQRGISQLSGGQRQRVATARALAVEPRVLLLDEPLGALDRQIRQRLQKELSQLLRRLSVTALLVTHDQQEAFAMADRVAVMHHGRLLQVSTPTDLYSSPETEFVANFLGKGRLIEGKVTSADSRHLIVEAEGGRFNCRGKAPVGAVVRVLIRPEHLFLAPSTEPGLTWTDMTIEEVVPAGETTDLLLGRGNFKLDAVMLGRVSHQPGTRTGVKLDPNGPIVMQQVQLDKEG